MRLEELCHELWVTVDTRDISRAKHLAGHIILQGGEIILLCFVGIFLETNRVGLVV
jgi:hypothetical protein